MNYRIAQLLAMLLLALLLGLAGCATPQGTSGTPTPSPTLLPSPSPTPSLSGAEEAVTLAKEHLAARLAIPIGEISLVSQEAVNWPDTSLGMPEPGKAYAQVIVPGFKITLAARGTEYIYHAGELGGKITVVPGKPTPASAGAERAVALAREHLAARLAIPIGEISLVSQEAVNWPNTSLGMPEPGKAYAQVIVPGFKITLAARGTEYIYHAGELGGKITVVPGKPG